MWYVIQTISGNEHEICMWINTYMDKTLFTRCFVPLYEDVWRKEGIGHISIRRMFSGYIFLETHEPEKVHDALKGISQLSVLLSVKEKEGRSFIPLHKDEEVFFDSILSDGIMKVSYVHPDRNGRLERVIGPLQSYQENIVRVDLPHRRAIVNIPIMGEDKRLKFGLWLDVDPKQDWIEEEKKNRTEKTDKNMVQEPHTPTNPWDWKEWKRINEEKKKSRSDEGIYGYMVGDHVINTTGIYGDIPLEIVEVHPDKGSVIVNVMLFGNMTRVDMGMGEISICGKC